MSAWLGSYPPSFKLIARIQANFFGGLAPFGVEAVDVGPAGHEFGAAAGAAPVVGAGLFDAGKVDVEGWVLDVDVEV